MYARTEPPPINLALFWANRRASTTPIIYLYPDPADVCRANIAAMRDPINAPDACRERQEIGAARVSAAKDAVRNAYRADRNAYRDAAAEVWVQ
jgi:hypothetical protein